MSASRSIHCLWVGSIASSVCAAFGIGYDHGTRAVVAIEQLDLGGGQAFALTFPSLVAMAAALVFFAFAFLELLVSWLSDKQALFSRPHIAALLLAVPLCATVSYVLNF